MSVAAWVALRMTSPVSTRSGDSQNQPQLAYIARRQRCAAMSVAKVRRAACVRARQPLGDEAGLVLGADHDIDVGVPSRPRVGRARQ